MPRLPAGLFAVCTPAARPSSSTSGLPSDDIGCYEAGTGDHGFHPVVVSKRRTGYARSDTLNPLWNDTMRAFALVMLALLLLEWGYSLPTARPAHAAVPFLDSSQKETGFLGLRSVAALGDDFPVEHRNVLRDLLMAGK